MKSNPWAKLAGISLVGIFLSFAILWGVQQITQYNYYNGTQMQMNGNMNMNGNMRMNGNMNNNSNMQGGMMDDDMNMMKGMM